MNNQPKRLIGFSTFLIRIRNIPVKNKRRRTLGMGKEDHYRGTKGQLLSEKKIIPPTTYWI